MKKTHGLVVIALALSVASGCSKADRHAPPPTGESGASAPAGAVAADAPAAVAATKGTVEAPAASNRALVVTGEVHVKANNVGGAVDRIRREVERAGGYVSSGTETGSGDAKTATLEVRVPSDRAHGLRAALADVGQITSDVEKVEDVTEARADLKARLQNARVEEKRILEIMNQRTGSIAEVLAAERELARVQETIERLEAQDRTMEGRIALATVKIHVEGPSAVAKQEPEAWRTPGKSVAQAFSAGLRAAAALGVYGAMALAASTPILLPLGALLAVAIGVVRSRRRRLAAAEAG